VGAHHYVLLSIGIGDEGRGGAGDARAPLPQKKIGKIFFGQ